MAFADESTAPRLWCGWGYRAESAVEVAARVQAINQRLAQFEPAHRDLWLLFLNRKPNKIGPILDMTVEEFGQVIDHLARYDPPNWPAPVGPCGYHLVASAFRPPDVRHVALIVDAGCDRRCEWSLRGNGAQLDFHSSNPIWRDVDRGLELLHALIDCMGSDWACVSGYVDGEDDNYYFRPWLAWAKPGAKVKTSLIERGGPPAEVRADHGGELSIWP